MKFVVAVNQEDTERTGVEPGMQEVYVHLYLLSEEDRKALFACSASISETTRRLWGPVIGGHYGRKTHHVLFRCPASLETQDILTECFRCLSEMEILRKALQQKAAENVEFFRTLPVDPDIASYQITSLRNRLVGGVQEDQAAFDDYLTRCRKAAVERERPTADAIRKIGHLPLTEYGGRGLQTVKHIVGPIRDALGEDYARLYSEGVKRAEEINASLLKKEEVRKAKVHARMIKWLQDRGETILVAKIEEGFSCGADLRKAAFEKAVASIYLVVPQQSSINPENQWDGFEDVRSPSNAAFLLYQELRRRGVCCSIKVSTRIKEEDSEDTEDLGRQEVIVCDFPCPWDPAGDKSYTGLVVSSPTFRCNV